MPQRSLHKRYGALAIAAAIAIVISFFIAAKSTLDRRAALEGQHQADHRVSVEADRAACLRINKLDRAIQKQVRISMAATPKIQYYKQHRKELRRVLALDRAEIRTFAPVRCP